MLRLTLPGKTLFSPPKPEMPPPPPPPVEPNEPVIREAEEEERRRLAARRGRRATIATTPLGVTGEEAPVARRSLGGGD